MYQWFTLSQVPKVHIFIAGMKKPAQWRATDQIEGGQKQEARRWAGLRGYLCCGFRLRDVYHRNRCQSQSSDEECDKSTLHFDYVLRAERADQKSGPIWNPAGRYCLPKRCLYRSKLGAIPKKVQSIDQNGNSAGDVIKVQEIQT